MQKIITWQKEQAQKEHLEPFMVLQFATIKEIVRIKPKTHDELIRIKGIGPAKVRKYGDAIVALVREDGVVGGETPVRGGTLFDEAEKVNEAARTSHNPPPQMACDPETGEIIDDTKDDSLSVTDFVSMLDTTLRTQFHNVRIQGEVVGFKCNANGHAYFEIKDAESVLRCAVFRNNYQLAGIDLADGMEIVITGSPNYHNKYGFSFIGETIELYGEGALKKAYDALKKKCIAEGLCESARKRSVPKLPHNIGLITSRTGAAIGDFTSNVGQYGYHIFFHDTRVEGARAIAEIKRALETLRTKELDVLVIVRGGGSLESLQAFNNETIIRMIADFPAVRESWDRCGQYVQSAQEKMLRACENAIHTHARALDSSGHQLMGHLEKIIRPFQTGITSFFAAVEKITRHVHTTHTHLTAAHTQMITTCEHIIITAKNRCDMTPALHKMHATITHKNHKLRFAQQLLTHNDPHRQLERGYSITRTADGTLVRSTKDAAKGDTLTIRVHDGTITTKKL